jgi:hypothetical protein
MRGANGFHLPAVHKAPAVGLNLLAQIRQNAPVRPDLGSRFIELIRELKFTPFGGLRRLKDVQAISCSIFKRES